MGRGILLRHISQLFCLPMSHKKDARLILVNDMSADQEKACLFNCLHVCTIKSFHMLIHNIFISNIFLIQGSNMFFCVLTAVGLKDKIFLPILRGTADVSVSEKLG